MQNYVERELWEEAKKVSQYKGEQNTRQRWKEYRKLSAYISKEVLYNVAN